MALVQSIPVSSAPYGSDSDRLPSISDLVVLDITREPAGQLPTHGLSRLDTTTAWTPIRRESSSREQDTDHGDSRARSPPLNTRQGWEHVAGPRSPRPIVRLPSFSELQAQIATSEPEWPSDSQSVRRRSSLASICSAPSLTGTISSFPSPISSPRSPSTGYFPQLHMPPPQECSNSCAPDLASEYLLSRAKMVDDLSCRDVAAGRRMSVQSNPAVSPGPGYMSRPVRASTPPRGMRDPFGGRLLPDDILRRERFGSIGSSGGVMKRSPKAPHINKEYTLEQNMWIIYNHVDLKKPWKEVEDEFGRHFGIKVRRTDGGLQSTYYRWNEECPVFDENGLLQYGEGTGYNRWDVRIHKAKVRGSGKISLIDRYATEVVEAGYSWILPHDMARARDLAERRRPYREAYERQKKAKLSQLMDCT